MSELAAVLRDVAKQFEQLRIPFAVVGGIAVSVRGTTRFTRDADFAVAVPSDAEAERLARDLRTRGYQILAQVEHRQTRRLAILRLASPKSSGPSSFIVDLLFASSSLEPEIVAAAQPAEVLSGLWLPVARRGHLIAMKVVSASDIRWQDKIDLLDLIGRAEAEDLPLARAALESVRRQGLEPDRDLAKELDGYIRLAAESDPTFIPRPLPPEPPP